MRVYVWRKGSVCLTRFLLSTASWNACALRVQGVRCKAGPRRPAANGHRSTVNSECVRCACVV
jgi:hypothetical protein